MSLGNTVSTLQAPLLRVWPVHSMWSTSFSVSGCFLRQTNSQVKMKVDIRAPSRGSVPCGRPSAEAKETVSAALPPPTVYNDLFRYFVCLSAGQISVLSAASRRESKRFLGILTKTLGRLTNMPAWYFLTLIHKWLAVRVVAIFEQSQRVRFQSRVIFLVSI